MKTYRFYLLGFIFISSFIFSQSIPPPEEEPEGPIANPIVFRYDEAGNQIYRGGSMSHGKVPEKQEPVQVNSPTIQEDSFWQGIQIYPVPVKDILNITWNENNDELIDNVALYQHNSLAFLFQQKNFPNLNRMAQINMSGYYMGVYILSFQLKDGRIISRNIIKE